MGNHYDDHPLMVSSGEFWRCDHGAAPAGECIPCAEEKRRELKTKIRRMRLKRKELKDVIDNYDGGG